MAGRDRERKPVFKRNSLRPRSMRLGCLGHSDLSFLTVTPEEDDETLENLPHPTPQLHESALGTPLRHTPGTGNANTPPLIETLTG